MMSVFLLFDVHKASHHKSFVINLHVIKCSHAWLVSLLIAGAQAKRGEEERKTRSGLAVGLASHGFPPGGLGLTCTGIGQEDSSCIKYHVELAE
ncbi:hypothetical protein Micbo1qcDRAFT_157446, partial [Microdochium bolleyi]